MSDRKMNTPTLHILILCTFICSLGLAACGSDKADKPSDPPEEDAGQVVVEDGGHIEADASVVPEPDAGPQEDPCTDEKMAACAELNRQCSEGECVLSGPAQILASANGSEVSDDGSSSVTVAIRLSAAPHQDVTVSAALSGAGRDDVQIAGGTSSLALLTFTPDNWKTAQSVTIAGVGDEVVDGDKNFALDLTSASSDADFSGLTASVPLVNTDTESYSLKLTLPDLLETTEDGGQVRIGLRLAARPSANVTIPVSLSVIYAEVEPASLTFEPSAWNVEQEVTVTGKDDGDAVNNTPHTYRVIFGPLTSEDGNFAALEPTEVELLNADNDVPRLVADRSSFAVCEKGCSDAVYVRLSSQPKVETTVTASISEWCRIRAWNPELHADEIVESTQLVFTPENWEERQPVGLTGVEDDGTPDGHHPCTLTLTASSSDTNERTSFNGVTLTIEGKNFDMNEVGITLKNDASELSEKGAESNKGYPESSHLCFQLGSRPRQAVTLNLTSSNTLTGATVSPTQLNIRPDEWNQEKCAVVKAVDDAERDFTQEVTVTARSTSADSDYNDRTVTQQYTVRDRNVGGLVREYNFKRVLEGDTPTFGFKLGAKPKNPVTVTLTGNDDSQLKLLTSSSVTIQPSDWDKYQYARFEAILDGQVDGNKNVLFSVRSTSADDDWDGRTASVMFTVMDAEKPQISLSCSATEEKHAYCGSYDAENQMAFFTSEKGAVSGGSVTCDVRLAAKPSGNVTVRLATGQKAFSSSQNGSTGTVSIFSRTFTPQNYNQPQTVTMYYMPEENPSAAYRSYKIRASADSSGGYNAEAVDSDSFDRYYTCGFYYFRFKDAPRSVNLPPGKYKLSAWGASGGRPEDKNMQVDENGKFVCFNSGGRGAMVSGELQLTENTPVYVRTGEAGISSKNLSEVRSAYNGGGEGMPKYANCDGIGGGGGGGSDFCVSSLDPNPCASQYEFEPYRLLSAGGGGGGSNPDKCTLEGVTGEGGSGADIEDTRIQNTPGGFYSRRAYHGRMGGQEMYQNSLTGNFIPLAQQGTLTGEYAERTGFFFNGMSVHLCHDSAMIVHGDGCQRGGGGGGWYGGLAYCGYYSYVGGGGGGSYAFTGTRHGEGKQETKYSLTNTSSIGGYSEMPIYSLDSSGSIAPKFTVSQKRGNIGNGFAVIEVLPVKAQE